MKRLYLLIAFLCVHALVQMRERDATRVWRHDCCWRWCDVSVRTLATARPLRLISRECVASVEAVTRVASRRVVFFSRTSHRTTSSDVASWSASRRNWAKLRPVTCACSLAVSSPSSAFRSYSPARHFAFMPSFLEALSFTLIELQLFNLQCHFGNFFPRERLFTKTEARYCSQNLTISTFVVGGYRHQKVWVRSTSLQNVFLTELSWQSQISTSDHTAMCCGTCSRWRSRVTRDGGLTSCRHVTRDASWDVLTWRGRRRVMETIIRAEVGVGFPCKVWTAFHSQSTNLSLIRNFTSYCFGSLLLLTACSWRPTLWNCRPVPSTMFFFAVIFYSSTCTSSVYLTVKLILPINIEKKIALMIRHVMLRHVSCFNACNFFQFWLIGFWCLYYRARVNNVSNLNILRFVGVSSPVLPLNFWCGIIGCATLLGLKFIHKFRFGLLTLTSLAEETQGLCRSNAIASPISNSPGCDETGNHEVPRKMWVTIAHLQLEPVRTRAPITCASVGELEAPTNVTVTQS